MCLLAVFRVVHVASDRFEVFVFSVFFGLSNLIQFFLVVLMRFFHVVFLVYAVSTCFPLFSNV